MFSLTLAHGNSNNKIRQKKRMKVRTVNMERITTVRNKDDYTGYIVPVYDPSEVPTLRSSG